MSHPSTTPELNTTANSSLSATQLREALYGFELSQVLYATVKLGIADHLQQQPQSCQALATTIGAHPQTLDHLLRTLDGFGLVTKAATDHYSLTAVGALLSADHPDSLRGTILSLAEIYQAWGQFTYSVQTGQAAFEKVFRGTLYEYIAQQPAAQANFNQWMEETTRDWLLPALKYYDFAKCTHVVDVGGGTGKLTAALLNQYPQLQATLFDQPQVVRDAAPMLASAQVSHRCQVRGGDFFQTLPTGGDLYLISRVLLNWDDTKALQLLRTCRAAMGPAAKLLIMDFILPNQESTALDFLGSLHLLVLGGRLLRTADEYSALLLAAGFHSPQLIQTAGFIHFIEALPSP